MADREDSANAKPATVERSKAEIRERVDYESRRRARLGVPAFAGGVLYLLGAITQNATLKNLPTVGALQGVAPALSGQVNPAVSPRAAEVRYLDHHAFGLIASSVIAAAGIGALIVVLLFLFDAARFRRDATSPISRPLVLAGGIALPVLTVVGQIVQAIATHNFVSGHDFTTHAVEQTVTKNGVYVALSFITPLAALALVGGMITMMVSTVRVGLQPRWMGIVGGVAAVIIVIPSPELTLLVAFWMVGMGLLLMGRFPGGDPPAWAAGAARPWPSQLEARAEREARRGGGGGGRQGNGAAKGGGRGKLRASAEAVPEPVQPTGSGGRRRRKRK